MPVNESIASAETKKEPQVENLQLFVPRPGIEPGWIAPLVFETSASTDSAIWALAFCECKGTIIFQFCKIFGHKILINVLLG